METTVNIRVDIYDKITRAARWKGISRSDLIVLLLQKMMTAMPNPDGIGKMVQYQERCDPTEWQKLHVSLRWDEYEYFLDLRKLLKMSVSLILAYAVNTYLKHLMRKDNTDNYQHQNYVLAKRVIDGIVSWTSIWGYPQKLDKFLNFNQIA